MAEKVRVRSLGERVLRGLSGRPVLLAVGVLLSGFGALAVMYLTRGRIQYPALRGLLGFASATYGDALLLPLVAFAIARFHQEWGGIERHLAEYGISGRVLSSVDDARVLPTSVAAGIVGTSALYATWLLDPGIEPNWTMPSAGHLNLYGWWHLGFFCVMSVWLWTFFLRAGVLLYACLKVPAKSFTVGARSAVAAGWPFAQGAVGSLVIFSVLLAYDYRDSLFTVAGGWTWWFGLAISAAAIVVLNVALVRVVVRPRRDAAQTCAKQEHGEIRRGAAGSVMVAACFVVALSVVSIVLTWRLGSVRPVLLLGPIAVSGVAAWNYWQALYEMQHRRLSRAGAATILAIFVLFAAGFGMSLLAAEAMLPESPTSLAVFAGAFGLVAIGVVLTTALALLLGIMNVLVEENVPDEDGVCGVRTRLDAPGGEVVQNFVQFGLMQLMLVAPLGLFRTKMLTLGWSALEPGDVLQLFYGYAALVGVAITFPLSQNIAYVRDLKVHALDHEAERPEELVEAKSRGDYYTGITIAVGGITLVEIASAWVALLMKALS